MEHSAFEPVPLPRYPVGKRELRFAVVTAILAVGLWKDTTQLKSLWKEDTVYDSQMDDATRDRLIRGWRKAVGRSLDWEEHE